MLGSSESEQGLATSLGRASKSATAFFDKSHSLTKELERVAARLETTISVVEGAMRGLGELDADEIRKILQDEGVKVILID